ncbi:hypothetical protein [Cohnella lupini]|uniref:Uncharacterized protein n=1 Tax=Cohnella lupini TaxID=1294267 RepID=A0A3D9IVC2_9BACL|nr:hypothetical protein [Cohnella lupini]RED65748.1 hypothetical protein DFP95_101239 [Cohnella lupini]
MVKTTDLHVTAQVDRIVKTTDLHVAAQVDRIVKEGFLCSSGFMITS